MIFLKEFLSDKDGTLSSKRLGFLTSLATSIILSGGTLAYFLRHGQYELALNLLDSLWLATFGFGGLVAAEILKTFKGEK